MQVFVRSLKSSKYPKDQEQGVINVFHSFGRL